MPTFSLSLDVTAAVEGSGFRSLSKYTSIDNIVTKDGVRRLLPFITYVKDVSTVEELEAVPYGRSFLMSESFDDRAGVLYGSGAGPGYIGFKGGTSPSNVRYDFRKPEISESIWHYPERCLYRFESGSWKRYRSLPQRALDGIQVFETFDPDGVYDYFASILGAMQSQFGIDTRTLSRLFSADYVPDEFISALAATIGAEYEASFSEAQKRASIALAVPASRQRGTDAAPTIRLLADGYQAETYDIHEKMQWPKLLSNNTSIRITVSDRTGFGTEGFDGSINTYAGNLYFYQYWVPDDGSWFEMTDVSAGITQRFSFGAGSGIIIPVTRSAITQEDNSAATMAATRSAVNSWRPSIAAYAETDGPLYIIQEHGYSIDAPRKYYPSKFLCVIVTQPDGSPINDLTKRTDWRRRIYPLIPVHARLKDFGTRAPSLTENVACSESFSAALV